MSEALTKVDRKFNCELYGDALSRRMKRARLNPSRPSRPTAVEAVLAFSSYQSKRLEGEYRWTLEEYCLYTYGMTLFEIDEIIRQSGNSGDPSLRIIPARTIDDSLEYVYFIHCGPGGYVKIGHTSRALTSRIASLQTGSPYLLELIGAIPRAGRDIELFLHKRFKESRRLGEWFMPCSDLLTYIAAGVLLHEDRELVIRTSRRVKEVAP